VKYAREKGIDLIVIGTQGKRGIERILLGSVAENIIRAAPCKILVVK
jgi:nucleotide-binding universal stress UspA family protein